MGRTTKAAKRAGNANGQAPRKPTPAPRPPIQETVNELVWQHGANVHNHANWPTMLAQLGLTPADVSPGMIDRADHAARERWQQKTIEHNGQAHKPFRVVNVGHPDSDPAANEPQRLDMTETQLIRREQEFLQKLEKNAPRHSASAYNTNDESNDDSNPNQEENIMHVSEKAARELLDALGRDTAKWPVTRLANRLNDAAKMVAYDAAKLDGPPAELYQKILGALDAKRTIMVGEKPAPAKGKGKQQPPATGKANGKAKAEKKTKESGPSNKETVHREWIKSKEKAEPEQLLNKVGSAVKESTIRGWISAWKRGQNLPGYVNKGK